MVFSHVILSRCSSILKYCVYVLSICADGEPKEATNCSTVQIKDNGGSISINGCSSISSSAGAGDGSKGL